MAFIPQLTLFSWEEIEEIGDLRRLVLVLDSMPDEPLMRALETGRGRGRNDYPVRAMWNSLLAGVVFEHRSIESLRRELLRNGQLRHVCGFDSLRGVEAVPSASAYSRFLSGLMDHTEEVEELFERVLWLVSCELPDFAQHVAIDGKAISSHARRKGRGDDRRGELDADWGTKSYSVNREDGSVERKSRSWFGFKLHTVVDSTYELPLAFELTKASEAEQPVAGQLLEHLEEKQSLLFENIEYLSADKGYDTTSLHRRLWDEHGIKPVIDIRNLWKKPDGSDSTCGVKGLPGVAYSFDGKVYCYSSNGRRHKMAFGGFEKNRGTLKYRCPAHHYGTECCSKGSCPLGKSVRVPIDTDRRVFGPVARDSYVWKDLYKKRTAAERVYSRLDTSFGFELHTIRGLAKMKLRVGIAYMAMLAMALGRIKQNKADQMRSLVASA